MRKKNRPNTHDDDYDFYPGSLIGGVGSYQCIGGPQGKTKFKNPIGFIRPKKQQPKYKRK